MSKKILVFLLAAFGILTPLSSTESRLPTQQSQTQSADSVTLTTEEVADKLVEMAKKCIGAPYVLGGKGPNVFDCSGFTSYLYKHFGYSLSGSALVQATQGREIKGSISDLQRGDLIFYGSIHNVKKLGHVALYIGPDESGEGFYIIHATVKKGIQISNNKEAYYSARFLGARRVLPDFYPKADSTIIYLDSLIGKMVKDQPDTLKMKKGDKKILLFSDSTWAYVDSAGLVTKPLSSEKIVLDPSGRWTSLRESTHRIPSISASYPGTAGQAPYQSAAVQTNSRSATARSTAQYHTIKSGDSLSVLAQKYHTTVSALCSLNGMKKTDILKIGKKIRVK